MNLVKLQDDLKMLPMAALQAKAQGQDPQVPPWLATSVLNERMDAQKKASLSQGAQGPQPSIAEQLNQKAGLMALQGQQQQQAQQQMMSQMAQAPQPTPENVPQPEQQPEPQMMARGGLARLPVDSRMFDYRAGGIIGFAEGDTVPPVSERWQDMTKRPDESNEEFARRVALARQASYQSQMAPTEEQLAAKRRAALELERARNMAQVQQEDRPPRPAMENDPRLLGGLPAALPKAPPPPPAAAAAPRPRVAPAPAAPTPPTGIQTALPQAAPVQSELEKKQMELLMKEPAARTLADIQAERKAATPELLNEPAGLAQLARLKQQQEQYAKGQADRPYERLMSVLAAGGRGGVGSMTSGYLGAVQGERASDAAQAAYQDKVMTAIDAARRGEATTEQTALLAAMGGERAAQAEAAGKRLTGIGTAVTTDKQAQTAGLDRASREKIAAAGDATSLKIANIQAAVSREAKAQGLGTKEIQAAEAAYARDPRAQAIKKMLESPMYSMGVEGQKRAQPLIAELEQIQRSKYTQFGATLEPSPGAKAPASTPGANTRMKFDAKGNPI